MRVNNTRAVSSVFMAKRYTAGMHTPPSIQPSMQPSGAPAPEARRCALDALLCADVAAKCERVSKLSDALTIDIQANLPEPEPLPGSAGRPQQPELVSPSQLKHRSVNTAHGRAVLLHALAHIEFNAINLALDIVWRFPNMPESFYRDWLKVAREEAYHFELLQTRLQNLDHSYGDFPAHHGLWEMAAKTAPDLLARLALVPRTLEARGLDASPAIRNKLAQAGDAESAAVLDIILRDEIGHVAIGNQWYRFVCQQRGLDPLSSYDELAAKYNAPRLRGPFNLQARKQAGFDDEELARLQSMQAAG